MKRRLMMLLFTLLLSAGSAMAADETPQQGEAIQPDSSGTTDSGSTSEDCGPLW